MLRGGQVLLNYFVLFLFVLVWFIFLCFLANMFQCKELVLRWVGSGPPLKNGIFSSILCRLMSHTCFFRPSAISKHFPVAWTLLEFSLFTWKKFSAVYTESLVKEAVLVGFHTFLMGMYGCERTVSCMVWSDCKTVRTMDTSFWQMWLGKCFFFLKIISKPSFPCKLLLPALGAICRQSYAFVAVSK